MVATEVASELHVPHAVGLDSVVVASWQICIVPLFAIGAAFTVTGIVTKQPDGSVYDIVAVPGASALATPPDTETTAASELLHAPPGDGCE